VPGEPSKKIMRKILLLTFGALALLVPALQAQTINLGPGGITIAPQHHYYNEEQRREYWHERQMRREHWRQHFYEEHGYWPD
jgi:hypothetical protein